MTTKPDLHGLGYCAAAFMLALLTLSLLLILDIDRPNKGGVREAQTPMIQLRASFKAQPPAVFDHYLIEDAKAGVPAESR